MNCRNANKISIVEFLKREGMRIAKENERDSWFLSPFRSESTPSFKVDKTKNLFYDFGEGIGGNLIDFVMIYKKWDLRKTLNELSKGSFSFNQHKPKQPTKKAAKYTIKEVRSISSPALIAYLEERAINLDFAQQFCTQVHYQFTSEKTYFGLGFKNDVGGYELRNRYFKGCLGSKSTTTITQDSSTLSMFESWSDFLSYLTLKKQIPHEDFIVLNSTFLASKCVNKLNGYEKVKTFFDNDEAGYRATLLLQSKSTCAFRDLRKHYSDFNDLNDFLLHKRIG
ncbi:hypothetical protein BST86_03815 [Nonlabens agnitus]|uniref:Zinc finger CHC2-type domain-containing protein n=2 Tax=Nonlabens agnitus TaxID=870484 RepID=A0A2S9WXT7_9FLAO|nr:hypothetical protein BST86_03815 [Nonlabens agnitus]